MEVFDYEKKNNCSNCNFSCISSSILYWHRYTEWNDGEKGGELYDYQVDPNENDNLYNNPKYKKIQKELQEKLYKKIEK